MGVCFCMRVEGNSHGQHLEVRFEHRRINSARGASNVDESYISHNIAQARHQRHAVQVDSSETLSE